MKMIITTALNCEAIPIIKHYGLKKIESGPFQIYESGDISCLITGIGKINTACAVGFTGNIYGGSAWLNIGLAGHKEREVGTGFLAQKIIEKNKGKSFFPTMHPKFPQKRETLVTVELPEKKFQEGGMYDMEAFGFVQAAKKFSCIELIQCYKVISDNLVTGTCHINKKTAEEMIYGNMQEIENLIEVLQKLAKEISFPPKINEIIKAILQKAHFTESQKHQLKKLATKWNALNLAHPAISQNNAKEILNFLQSALEKETLKFEE